MPATDLEKMQEIQFGVLSAHIDFHLPLPLRLGAWTFFHKWLCGSPSVPRFTNGFSLVARLLIVSRSRAGDCWEKESDFWEEERSMGEREKWVGGKNNKKRKRSSWCIYYY
jgi:hypothetical protein